MSVQCFDSLLNIYLHCCMWSANETRSPTTETSESALKLLRLCSAQCSRAPETSKLDCSSKNSTMNSKCLRICCWRSNKKQDILLIITSAFSWWTLSTTTDSMSSVKSWQKCFSKFIIEWFSIWSTWWLKLWIAILIDT